MATAPDDILLETDDVVIVGRSGAPEIYAEGIAQLLLGYPNSRVYFQTLVTQKSEGSKEVRRAVATITMPTASLIESATRILEAAKGVEDQLSKFHVTWGDKLAEVLANANISNAQVDDKASKH